MLYTKKVDIKPITNVVSILLVSIFSGSFPDCESLISTMNVEMSAVARAFKKNAMRRLVPRRFLMRGTIVGILIKSGI